MDDELCGKTGAFAVIASPLRAPTPLPTYGQVNNATMEPSLAEDKQTGGSRASRLTVLYASQTGNAEFIAKAVADEARERGYAVRCRPPDHGDDKDEGARTGIRQLSADEAEALLAPPEKDQPFTVVVFVVSTTGDGDPPDSATTFLDWLEKSAAGSCPPGSLAHVRYAVLGLGDSSYDNYCNTAKRLEQFLKVLGASPFYPTVKADAAKGSELTVDPWVDQLWPALSLVCFADSQHTMENVTRSFRFLDLSERAKSTAAVEDVQPRPEENPVSGDVVPVPAQLVDGDSDGPAQTREMEEEGLYNHRRPRPLLIDIPDLGAVTSVSGLPRLPPQCCKLVPSSVLAAPKLKEKSLVPDFLKTPSPVLYATPTRFRQLTSADALKRTLLVEARLPEGDAVQWVPGDVFGFIVPNRRGMVKELIRRLGIPAGEDKKLVDVIAAEGSQPPSHLEHARGTTIRELLEYAVDIKTFPRKALMRLFAEYGTHEDDKKALLWLASKEGAGGFDVLRAQAPSLLDILKLFPSVSLPVERLLDVLPPLQPRYYSVASSPLADSHLVTFAFNVVRFFTPQPYDQERMGHATTWIERTYERLGSSAAPPRLLPMYLRPPTKSAFGAGFHLPEDPSTPVILIGPGTGIAPFMGFLAHRHLLREQGPAAGDSWVFHGCRERKKDYLFRDELEAYARLGTIAELTICYSREPRAGIDADRPKYVQDAIRLHGRKFWRWMDERGAAIYVCGDARGMARGVNDSLVDIAVDHGGLSKKKALDTIAEWSRSKRYLRDLWG
ncbi:MAG: hypothetical protein BJ554DRAFT_8186 [Olpidium bornovanus]|uniref:Methionine synthase reductase n=1 Tax=Olpidium bornovanus TaxID=278681 RepID=A0A8H7ZVK7_9FUNG|nr:MAG: hypothetical protein BJ554DRAFT_8186 [Olpidium bornovanus]